MKLDLHQHQLSVEATSVIIALLLFLYCVVVRTKKNTHKPPQPSGSWPFIGHLPLMGKLPHISLGKLVDQYGPIFMINLGVKRALVVSSPEMAKECLGVNDKVFVNRPRTFSIELLGYNYAMFGFSPMGEYWRLLRKTTTVKLLSNNQVEMRKQVRISEVRSAMKILLATGSEPIDMKQWFKDVVMNTIVRLVSGRSFREMYEGEDYNRYAKAFREFFELITAFVPANALPFLKWLDIGGYENKMKTVAKEIDDVAQMWLEEHKATRCLEERQESKDFMDALLGTFGSGQENHSLFDADTITKANCMLVILAGADTTTATLIWALSLLLNNKDDLTKVQSEIDSVVGKERLVDESDLKSLDYLEAVLKETLRLYPPGPLLVPRESISDCTVGGYHIPSGTQLFVNIYKLQRDPEVWKDPLGFHPERFLTASEDYDFRGNNFEYIPFGSGRRMCPAILLSSKMMMLTLANLLHGFDISVPGDESIDMTEGFGISNLKATALEVILTPRLPHHVYNDFTTVG